MDAKHFAIIARSNNRLDWLTTSPVTSKMKALEQFHAAVGIDPDDEGLESVIDDFAFAALNEQQYAEAQKLDGMDNFSDLGWRFE